MEKLWEKIVPKEAIKELPKTPGVYFFLDEKKDLLYIGKATSLCDRVKSYFVCDLHETRGPKIAFMLEKIAMVGYRKTDSVLEALLLETKLIKEHQPQFNSDSKDDKSYNHVVITKEKFPKVLIVRGRDIYQKDEKILRREYKKVFGPFPHGLQLREAMKIVRKIFPYRESCMPYEERPAEVKRKARPCFSSQIGLCPGVCSGEMSAREYGKTINHIRLFFEGHKNKLMKELEREMKSAAKRLEFEKAGEIKRTIFALQHIQDMTLVKDESRIMNHESGVVRIEAYDVAHLKGENSVGVMVVIQNGKPNK